MSSRHRGFKRKSHRDAPARVENAEVSEDVSVSQGFYDKCLTIRERLDMLKTFESEPTVTLEEEIHVLRTLIRRVLELSGKTDNLDEMVRVFNTVGMNAVRISKLLKEHQKLSGAATQTEKSLQTALCNIRADLDREGS